jgi:hypothetical protein
MNELDPITAWLNKYFGNLATQVLHAVHVQPYNPQAPITTTFAMELVVLGLLLVFFVLVRATLNVENPGPIQQFAEMINGFVSGQAESIIDHDSQRYVMFATSVLLFVLLSNLLGMVPGLIAPTSVATVPLGVALWCWFYYHYHGDHFPFGAHPFAHRPSLRQHVCRGRSDAGFLLPGPHRDSNHFYGSAFGGGADPGLYLYAADDDLCVPGSRARPVDLCSGRSPLPLRF